MNESKLRESLLRQHTTTTVENELQFLRELLETEQRRRWKLTGWTIITWIAWPVCILLLVFAKFLCKTGSTPSATPIAPPSAFLNAIFLIIIGIVGSAVVILPVAGVVLLMLSILAKRSAVCQSDLTDSLATSARNAPHQENC